MKKIKDKHIVEQHEMPTILIDWGQRIHFKNKDTASRVATKLNKHYQTQLQAYNFMLPQVYSIYRKYWLFIKPYDNRHISEVIHFIENELDHAFSYQDQTFNVPADLSRIAHDLTSAINALLIYANKRKDIPIKHELEYLKTRINDEQDRNSAADQAFDKPKRAAIRKTGSGI